MAHGLSGTRRDRLGPFAERFAAAGLPRSSSTTAASATAAASRTCSSPARQLEDWRAAIAFARSLPGIDPERVATFGSSMGGGNALAAAAADRAGGGRDQPGPVPRHRAPGPPPPPRVTARMLRAAARGGHLPAVGQPGEAAFINAPGSEAGWRRVVATGEDSRWRDRVSARWLLGRPFNPAATPRRCTARGSCASARPTGWRAGPGDRRGAARAAGRAAHLSGRRPLRHLRRARARGGRRRRGRVPARATCSARRRLSSPRPSCGSGSSSPASCRRGCGPESAGRAPCRAGSRGSRCGRSRSSARSRRRSAASSSAPARPRGPGGRPTTSASDWPTCSIPIASWLRPTVWRQRTSVGTSSRIVPSRSIR